MTLRDLILNTVDDLVTGFVYYDRKDDEELTMQRLNQAVKSGAVTQADIVEQFRRSLEKTYGRLP